MVKIELIFLGIVFKWVKLQLVFNGQFFQIIIVIIILIIIKYMSIFMTELINSTKK